VSCRTLPASRVHRASRQSSGCAPHPAALPGQAWPGSPFHASSRQGLCRALLIGLAALAIGFTSTAHGIEANAALTAAPVWESRAAASPYEAGQGTTRNHSRQDLELRLREGGFNAQATLRWQTAEGGKPEHHGFANQAYVDGDLGGGLGFTVGKKVLSWGVGFGFRPLDVVQRENRRDVAPPALVGLPLLALERFSADTAWTLAWVRPGHGAGANDSRDSSLAFHGYRLVDGDDVHAVARLSHRRGVELGLGATRVVGEEWSFHGAALYQRRYAKTRNTLAENGGLLAASDPMLATPQRHGLKAVAGAQWTSGPWSLLTEAWYDADAYSRAEWQRLDALTARQRDLAGVAPASAIAGNVAWSSQAYRADNLLRENLLLRLAHDTGDGVKAHAELLLTPTDGGRVVTLGVSHEGDRQRLSLGLRQLGGKPDSAYAQSPLRRIAWIEWRWALF